MGDFTTLFLEFQHSILRISPLDLADSATSSGFQHLIEQISPLSLANSVYSGYSIISGGFHPLILRISTFPVNFTYRFGGFHHFWRISPLDLADFLVDGVVLEVGAGTGNKVGPCAETAARRSLSPPRSAPTKRREFKISVISVILYDQAKLISIISMWIILLEAYLFSEPNHLFHKMKMS